MKWNFTFTKIRNLDVEIITSYINGHSLLVFY